MSPPLPRSDRSLPAPLAALLLAACGGGGASDTLGDTASDTSSGGDTGAATTDAATTGALPDPMNTPPVVPPDSPDHPICPMLERQAADLHPPLRPFAESSIWNRPIPADAEYADIQDALFGDPAVDPRSVTPDIITLCYTTPAAPLTNIEKSAGWAPAQRKVSTGELLYQRNLTANACGCLGWAPISNGLFALIDPATLRADLGVGGYRIEGGPLLNTADDGSAAHDVDVSAAGDGLQGYGRASSLPAIGGLLRPGELADGIGHALAFAMPGPRFSKTKHFTWPATSADGTADMFYQGPDENYTMGSLLAIPPDVQLDDQPWKTAAGRRIAEAAQTYGIYVVDNATNTGHTVAIATEDETARFDLAGDIDPNTGVFTVDLARFDGEGFSADVIAVLRLTRAVVSNAP